MIAVIQRVNNATVYADGTLSGSIGRGLYILLGVEATDEQNDASLLANKIAKLRIFSDDMGKMNLCVNDIAGEAMVVSNFTLCANYSHGNRPEYFSAAASAVANELYNFFTSELGRLIPKVERGVFGADMRTEMSTDGPVTIVMKSDVLRGGKK